MSAAGGKSEWLVVDGVTDYNFVVVNGAKLPMIRSLMPPEITKGRGPEILCSYEDQDGEMYLWVEYLKCGPDGSNSCKHFPQAVQS